MRFCAQLRLSVSYQAEMDRLCCGRVLGIERAVAAHQSSSQPAIATCLQLNKLYSNPWCSRCWVALAGVDRVLEVEVLPRLGSPVCSGSRNAFIQ